MAISVTTDIDDKIDRKDDEEKKDVTKTSTKIYIDTTHCYPNHG